MFRALLPSLGVALLVGSTTWAAPREWSDDFTVLTTYDSTSLLAPCYGGPPTKYTVINGITASPFEQRTVSGNGLLFLNSLNPNVAPGLGGLHLELIIIGWVGLSIGCPGEPPVLSSSETFTSPDLCLYGGILFSPWEVNNARNTFGPDARPGIANVDDDNDGTTDEGDESPNLRPTTVNGGFGNRDGTGYLAGQDDAPGQAGVDDDGNGTTDEYGEIGWAGTDDGDDRNHIIHWFTMRANILTSSTMYLNFDIAWSDSGFAIYQIYQLAYLPVEGSNEISSPGYYSPYTHYNVAFCGSGTCYGAVLWKEADMANVAETLGPIVNSYHNGPTDAGCAFGSASWTDQYGGGYGYQGIYHRQVKYSGNTNFSDTYWICSGVPTNADFTNGVFGYPSPSADLDNDRDVDVNDFLTFSGCFAGSLVPPAPGCQNAQADLDVDGDVDVNDFLTFSSCFAGSLVRPNVTCFPPDLTNCAS